VSLPPSNSSLHSAALPAVFKGIVYRAFVPAVALYRLHAHNPQSTPQGSTRHNEFLGVPYSKRSKHDLTTATINGERIAVLNEYNVRVDANIFDKEMGGMQQNSTEELDKRSLVTYFDVHVVVDRMKGAPFCVVDSMTIQICGDGKLWIKDAMINATMIKQYVLEKKWPISMTNDEKLVAAIMGYSMASDYAGQRQGLLGLRGVDRVRHDNDGAGAYRVRNRDPHPRGNLSRRS
jgi:hypothetical protein